MRTSELQKNFQSNNNMESEVENDEDDSACSDQDLNEINLTNQLIGEVQAFIFITRCQIFEFYQVNQLVNANIIMA